MRNPFKRRLVGVRIRVFENGRETANTVLTPKALPDTVVMENQDVVTAFGEEIKRFLRIEVVLEES